MGYAKGRACISVNLCRISRVLQQFARSIAAIVDFRYRRAPVDAVCCISKSRIYRWYWNFVLVLGNRQS